MKIVLPRLVGTRLFADELVDGLPGPLEGSVVEVDCAELRTGTGSFADQLVLRVLDFGKASSLQLIDAPDDFGRLVQKAAANHDVQNRVQLLVAQR